MSKLDFTRVWSDGTKEKFTHVYDMSEVRFVQFGVATMPWSEKPVLLALDADGLFWAYDSYTEEEERRMGATSGWDLWETDSVGKRNNG